MEKNEKKQIIFFQKNYSKQETLKKLKNPEKIQTEIGIFLVILQLKKLKNFENPGKNPEKIRKKSGQKNRNMFQN